MDAEIAVQRGKFRAVSTYIKKAKTNLNLSLPRKRTN